MVSPLLETGGEESRGVAIMGGAGECYGLRRKYHDCGMNSGVQETITGAGGCEEYVFIAAPQRSVSQCREVALLHFPLSAGAVGCFCAKSKLSGSEYSALRTTACMHITIWFTSR